MKVKDDSEKGNSVPSGCLYGWGIKNLGGTG